jgi:hypothetical protein
VRDAQPRNSSADCEPTDMSNWEDLGVGGIGLGVEFVVRGELYLLPASS